MKILALVPARGNSKRVPRKNVRFLGGKPLINWTIETALEIPEICDVLVSTDDPEIATLSRTAGGLVPWLRPASLATDIAMSVDVSIHALDWYESINGPVDGLLLLQPTSPFRSHQTIEQGIRLFAKNGCQSVLAVSPSSSHPMWALKMMNGYLSPFIELSGLSISSQDLPPSFSPNGVLYLVSPNELRMNHSFVGTKTVPLLIESPKESLDIDTEWDFQIAEFFVSKEF
jgi:CMP-N,N'-diacetyllegionaminic acid synthase